MGAHLRPAHSGGSGSGYIGGGGSEGHFSDPIFTGDGGAGGCVGGGGSSGTLINISHEGTGFETAAATPKARFTSYMKPINPTTNRSSMISRRRNIKLRNMGLKTRLKAGQK